MNSAQQSSLQTKLQQLQSMTAPSKPMGMTSFSRQWQADTPQPLPAYPAPGAGTIVLASFKLPAAMAGALSSLAIAHIGAANSFVDGSGTVVWHVFLNGAPVKGLENIYVQIGSPYLPVDTVIELVQNALLEVLVEIPAGQVAPVGNPFARLIGYMNFSGNGNQPASAAPKPPAAAPTIVSHVARSGRPVLPGIARFRSS
jgi:hypothetical protein